MILLNKVEHVLAFLKRYYLVVVATMFFMFVPIVQASEGGGGEESGGHGGMAIIFLWIAIILLAAKFAGLVERVGQPAVLGELVIGMILGNLYLVGFNYFEPVKVNEIIVFLAELGVVILLFQIGLESNIVEMQKVGMRATIVAIVGVIVPFGLGTLLVGPFLIPESMIHEGHAFNTYLFLGATLTATSVGITARVFSDLGKLHIPEAKIVLGAAVIDDVLGLIVLAVVSAIVSTGSVSVMTVMWILGKAVLFLGGTAVLGQMLAGYIGQMFSAVHQGVGMKFTLAISLGLIFAYLAEFIGLAPIVGAFAAGLVLEPVHFKSFKDFELIEDLYKEIESLEPEIRESLRKTIRSHSKHQVEELISPVGFFLIPIFFVLTGMNVKLETMFDPSILMVGAALTLAAVAGKYVTGFFAGDVNKAVVGWGMVPRGEVGLIFANVGKQLGVVTDEAFSVIVIMVIVTTLITPPLLTMVLKSSETSQDVGVQ
jgi:Kef-type K+ transport system membrane component KefB